MSDVLGMKKREYGMPIINLIVPCGIYFLHGTIKCYSNLLYPRKVVKVVYAAYSCKGAGSTIIMTLSFLSSTKMNTCRGNRKG